MSETNTITIHIGHLGPVRDSDIILKPVMVFTGESGTGKSYTALLVHYVYKVLCTFECSNFFKSLEASFDKHKSNLSDENGGVLFEFTLQQFENWLNKEAVEYVGGSIGNFFLDAEVNIKFTGLDEHYRFIYKRDVLEINGEMSYFDNIRMNDFYPLRLPHDSKQWGELPYSALFKNYLKTAYGIKQDKTFILPPSRGGLVCLNDVGRGNFLSSKGWMYNEFISDFSDLKSEKPNDEVYSDLSESLISGTINIKDDDLYYEQSYGEIPITAGAASIKELAPFAIMLQKGIVEQYSVMFEEPETNLHPELQIKVADILAYLMQKGCRFQITTHSDYFLRRVNDLIRLDTLKKKISDDEYQAFCKNHHYDSTLSIDKEKVGAFLFKHVSEYETVIQSQSIDCGIPFDTFQSVLDNQLTDSSYLYDKLCEINETAD